MRCERCNRFFEDTGRGPYKKRYCSDYCRKQAEKMRNRHRRIGFTKPSPLYGMTRDEISSGIYAAVTRDA